MTLKKLICFCAVFFAAIALYAQKPLIVTVWEEPNPDDAEKRVASLIWEYYKSELATHSGLKLADPDIVEKTRKAVLNEIKTPIPKDLVRKVAKATTADFLCAASMTHGNDDKYHMAINVFKADGTLVKTVKRDFDAIRASDYVTVLAARDTATAIRGEMPVDRINLEREKRLLDELNATEQEEKEKQTPKL